MPELETAVSETLRQALDELEQHERELQRRRRERGIDYYIPNPQQHKAHQSSAYLIIYVGGNRAGKSHFGAAELVMHLTRQYPDWFPKERRYTRPIKAVVVVTSFPIIERAIEPKIMTLLPKEYIAPRGGIKRTPQGYLARIKCVDGSTVDILTNEMDDMAFESADWDFYWGDEPQKKSKYYAIRRGLLDREGRGVMTFTPLVEPWMKEDLVDKEDGKEVEVFQVSLWDNRFDIEGHEIQSERAIRRFEQELPVDLRRTRIYGEFFHLRGIVYPEYTASVHERNFTYQYPDPVIGILDPHTRKPHHVLWAFLTRQELLCVDRELVMEGTVTELSRMILLTEAKAGYNMRRRLIDPNYGKTKMQLFSGRTVMEEMARPPFPVRFGEASDDKEAGILKVKEYLHYDRNAPISITNCPKLFFSHLRTPITIRQMRNYQHAEWSGKLRDERDPKEEIKKRDTDGPDCIRYLCMSNPRFDVLSGRHQLHQEPVGAYY